MKIHVVIFDNMAQRAGFQSHVGWWAFEDDRPMKPGDFIAFGWGAHCGIDTMSLFRVTKYYKVPGEAKPTTIKESKHQTPESLPGWYIVEYTDFEGTL